MELHRIWSLRPQFNRCLQGARRWQDVHSRLIRSQVSIVLDPRQGDLDDSALVISIAGNSTVTKMSCGVLVRYGCVFPLAVAVLTCNAQTAELMEKVQFGLRGAVDDSEIPLLLHDRPVVSSAAFTSVAGLSGTFRTQEGIPVGDLVREARRSSIEFFENSVEGNRQMIQQFLTKHSAEELTSSQELQRQAESLLRISNQFESALKDLRANVPIVYGLEVIGSEDAIRILKLDSDKFSFADMSAPKSTRMRTIRPPMLRQGSQHFIDDSIGSHNLHELLLLRSEEQDELEYHE